MIQVIIVFYSKQNDIYLLTIGQYTFLNDKAVKYSEIILKKIIFKKPKFITREFHWRFNSLLVVYL